MGGSRSGIFLFNPWARVAHLLSTRHFSLAPTEIGQNFYHTIWIINFEKISSFKRSHSLIIITALFLSLESKKAAMRGGLARGIKILEFNGNDVTSMTNGELSDKIVKGIGWINFSKIIILFLDVSWHLLTNHWIPDSHPVVY